MLTRVTQRYLFAAAAFLIAVLWKGIDLQSAFECLVVFSAVYVVAAAVQQRRTVVATRRRTRARLDP